MTAAVNVPMLWVAVSASGFSASTRAKEASDDTIHPTPASVDQAGNEAGGRWRIATAMGPIVQAIPTRYAAIPATASRWTEASTPAAVTRVPRTNAGSARRALRSAPGANRVRSIVGHRVTSVPMMGSPTQPIRFTDTWASSSWLCTVGACDPSARATPRAIPGISRIPAAT